MDAIHCHDLNTLYVGVFLKRKQKTDLLVYDSHELWTEMSGINSLVKKIYQKKEKIYLSWVDKVITVSPSISTVLKNRYCLEEAPIVIRNLPENSSFRGEYRKKKSNLEVNSPIKIIYVGYYLQGRGIEHVLREIPKTKECFQFYFRMEGNKNELERLDDIIKEMGIQTRVHILPFVPSDKLLQEIKKYDIGLLPYDNVSLNNQYCLPNKLFQYLEAQIAVVSNNLPDVKMILKKYKCGVCYDMNTTNDLANVLNKYMLQNVEVYKSNAKKAIKCELNWEQEKRELLKIYEKKVG